MNVTVNLTEDQAKYLSYWLDEQAKWLADIPSKNADLGIVTRVIKKIDKALNQQS